MKRHWSTKAQRMRGRAVWALIVGGIGLAACAVGIFQYQLSGIVSIRPGHPPVVGGDAILQLVFLGAVSFLFCAIGAILLYRARKLSEQ